MTESTAPQTILRKPEHECEGIIRKIQNRAGLRLGREEREAELVKLFGMFRYMIRKIARDTWERGICPQFPEWEQDTLSTFFELVVDDYTPIQYGGASPFAPYVQTKLYFRMLYSKQKLQRNDRRQSATDPIHFTDGLRDSITRIDSGSKTFANTSLREAIFQNVTDVGDDIVEQMRDDEITARIAELREIATKVLDERTLTVWNLYFFSETPVKDIGSSVTPPIGTSRVNQLVQQARNKVFEELGRRQVAESFRK